MKNINYIISTLFLILLSCSEETPELLTPSNLVVTSEISNDGSGKVTFEAKATNTSSFTFAFGDGTSQESFTGNVVKFYDMGGQNTYSVTVTANGSGGLSVSETIQIEVNVDGEASEFAEIISYLTNDDSKTWYLSAAEPGHLGVGPAREGIDGDWWYAKWYSAQAFEKCGSPDSDCLCDDELTFSVDGDVISYSLDNKGQTFFNSAHKDVVGGTEVDDFCYDFDTSGTKTVTLSSVQGNVPEAETTGTQIDYSDDGFMGYYVGSSTYEILSISEDLLYVRTYDPLNPDLAWYHRFSSEPATGGGDEKLESIYTNLVWSDEFDVDGAPNPSNWTYDLGAGGWGNNEVQTYTDDPGNVVVEGGMLKITAKSEGGEDAVHYFDDITLVATGGATSSVDDFEGTAPTFSGFGGASTQVVANPDASGANTSAMVGESTKPLGAETWAGSYFDVSAPLDLTTYSSISMKTWSPTVGAIVKLKLENSANADENFEVDMNTTVSESWETLTFDFSMAPAYNFDRIVVFFDFGVSPAGAYTSARIKSENLYEFTYGRVEIRAKLPSGGGTWPALWALGANFDTVGWPDCGEIDVMEHVGNSANIVSSALHYPGNFGGTAVTGSIPISTATSEFHNYTVEWTPDSIKFVVDDEFIHTSFVNSSATPFNADFFFIMNIAMGGTLGGAIDSAFTQDTMEVDYIRVYQ
ncbi:MAG: glycoside hydrolase family 16 protein [Eudoraea sp.]|uniref:glycoside hydrolase family 16 protein n=1 Tax=Eudoraea sp. TaxID=1979955 RepID=UPI003C730891